MTGSPLEQLRSELAAAEAELRAHMASWEYAFAMGGAAPTAAATIRLTARLASTPSDS